MPDLGRIEQLARALSGGHHPAFTFDTPPENFPPVGCPGALDFFFGVVLHQYGFWHLENGTWAGSLYASVDGVKLKGSDFVFRSATKAFMAGEDDYTRFLDDSGSCPLPMAETHAELAAGYRTWARRNPPADVVAEANDSGHPVERLMELIADCPGYREDPYRKKAMLLAMTLANRPERWLRRADGAELTGWGPVVDYHIQRTSLRTGVVGICHAPLRDKIIARSELTAEEENAVRSATFKAMEALSEKAGMSHAAIDFLFFQARRRCPESRDELIDCANCPLEAGCAKEKDLFQPVFRTTAY